MPVHRVPGSRGGVVFATAEELSEWRSDKGADLVEERDADAPVLHHADSRTRVRVLLGGSLLIALAVVFLTTALWRRASPVETSLRSGPVPTQKTPPVAGVAGGRSLVSLEIRVDPASKPVAITTRSGALFRLAVEGGLTLGVMAADHVTVVDAIVFLLPNAAGEARQIGTLHLAPGGRTSFAGGGVRFEIAWTGSRASSAAATPSGTTQEESCSISCDHLTVSAGAVESECGRCCDPSICRDTHWSGAANPR